MEFSYRETRIFLKVIKDNRYVWFPGHRYHYQSLWVFTWLRILVSLSRRIHRNWSFSNLECRRLKQEWFALRGEYVRWRQDPKRHEMSHPYRDSLDFYEEAMMFLQRTHQANFSIIIVAERFEDDNNENLQGLKVYTDYVRGTYSQFTIAPRRPLKTVQLRKRPIST
ncbi:unnamed protein product [Caenorhabditis auriculariae]|uniref:MADF domain-containing protein n=1 Tax=Caenorhabditis auriculariae TaxID=2777116 RepID=A0A8S1H0S0_9PELO|nr:unnamed protein product [Caenorhabditis auriculariae]